MDLIDEILDNVKTIAVVGLSDNPARDSHGVSRYMQSQGYRIIPVNPALKGATVLGEQSYDDLASALAAAQAQGVDIDLVDVCLPTALHHDVVLRALDAGKHVLVEKPIALGLDEADRMIARAGEAGRTLMVAHVLKFFPEFAFLKQAIDDGRYGRLLGLHLKRVISKPLWGEDNWFGDYERTGAAGIDLHIHDTDYLRYLFGMPDSVHADGMTSPNGYVLYLNTQYGYDSRDVTVSSQCGAISSAAFA